MMAQRDSLIGHYRYQGGLLIVVSDRLGYVRGRTVGCNGINAIDGSRWPRNWLLDQIRTGAAKRVPLRVIEGNAA